MDATIINTDGLTKQYAAVTALADCSLRIQRGEVFGLLGPNGSGKTTLLRLLMGFLRPTSGTATIDGLDCYRDSAVLHARVSYLPGEPRLFRRMSGRNVLKFFSGVRADGDLDRAICLAEQLHLDLSRLVATSSTGMRQKLALSDGLDSLASELGQIAEGETPRAESLRKWSAWLAERSQLVRRHTDPAESD